MEKKLICPLCRGNEILQQEVISIDVLNQLWKKYFKLDINHLTNKSSVLTKFKCSVCDLGFFDPLLEGDQAFYGHLSQDSLYYEHSGKTEYLESSLRIKPGSSVLDIGSGVGEFHKYLEKKNVDYLGVEFNESAVAIAKKNNVNVQNINIETLISSDKDRTFDYICVFQVLEHIYKIDSFMSAVKSLLKAGGSLFIAVPDNNSFLKDAHNNLLNLPPHHVLLWNEKSLKFLAEKYGLEVVDVLHEKVSDVHADWFKKTKAFALLKKVINKETVSVDNSLSGKILFRLSHYMSRIPGFLGSTRGNGHTILIELKKS